MALYIIYQGGRLYFSLEHLDLEQKFNFMQKYFLKNVFLEFSLINNIFDCVCLI